MKVTRGLNHVAGSVLAIALGAALVSSATAQTVLIDFGSTNSFRGVNVPNPDSNGNYWNSLSPGPFYTDLIAIDGVATTIDFGFSTGVGTDSYNGPAGATSFPNPTAAELAATDIDAAALGNLGVKEAAIDFAASPDGADHRTRFEIQQLDPTKTYDLTFFGSHKYSDNDTTIYSIYSDNTYTTLVASASLNVQTPGSPDQHNRDKVAVINGVAPQASNILYVQFIGSQEGYGYLNSMQVSAAVPEPSTFVLALGAVGLTAVYRRR